MKPIREQTRRLVPECRGTAVGRVGVPPLGGSVPEAPAGSRNSSGAGLSRTGGFPALRAFLILLFLGSSVAFARSKAAPSVISDLNVKGVIEGENISFDLTLNIEVGSKGYEVALVSGDMVLEELTKPLKGTTVKYDPDSKTYRLVFERTGTYEVAATFAARPVLLEDGPWRESSFSIPASRIRELEVTCDRTDLEVLFPHALRLTREVQDGQLTMKAILGPDKPFTVRWKPHVQEMDAKLVLGSEANTIVSASVGALRGDSLFVFDISQGKLRELQFRVPEGLNVTQVRGEHIKDWRIEDRDDEKQLTVSLNMDQTRQYTLQVLSEMLLTKFPAEAELKTVEPVGGIRSAGHLAVGTDSAIHLVVQRAAGLSQIDASEFPRMVLDRERQRPLPQSNAFYYAYASLPFQMVLDLDDIVPSFDASERMVIEVGEDNLKAEVDLEIDVRDAPIRQVTLQVAKGFMVSEISGQQVADHNLHDPEEDGEPQEVEIRFYAPVLGRALLHVRLETGRGPLGEAQRIEQIAVKGAKNERGYLVVIADEGIEIEAPKLEKLREVHTGSVPMKVANAKFAYRFREEGWSLELMAQRRPASIRAEALHLVSLGEGVLYGNVVVNYFISGAPVDELLFRLPETLKSVEFISRDIRRWSQEGEQWRVKLQRKIIGDYTLGVSYHKRYEEGKALAIGEVQCEGTETETGFVILASHLNLRLAAEDKPDESVLEIERDEVPANYRLLVHAPILKTWKYVDAPHLISLQANAYEREVVLPVVVEMMEVRTRVATREDGQVESVTAVRYKVKNSTNQYLALRMPPGAAVWSTRIIEKDAQGRDTAHRVTATQDPKQGVLMIPLQRLRNPNDPMTVELEYGQTHPDLGWDGQLGLTAPRSLVPATFATWEIIAPNRWSVLPGRRGNMRAEDIERRQGDLSLVLASAAGSWKWAFEQWRGTVARIPYLGAVLAFLILVTCIRRSLLPEALLGLLLAGAVWVGILALDAPGFEDAFGRPEYLTSIKFTQALSLKEDAPLIVSSRVIPSWRQDFTWRQGIGIPSVALLLLVLAARIRRARRFLASLAAVGLLYTAALFPVASPYLGPVLTWGIPSLFGLVLVWRGARRHLPVLRTRFAVATSALIVAALLAPGLSAEEPAAKNRTVLDRVECHLKAERDSMAIRIHLRINAPEAMEVPLEIPSAILLSSERISDYVFVRQREGTFSVEVKRKGEYRVDLEFLTPLGKPDEERMRQFRLPMPLAITNTVELTIPETDLEVKAPTAVRLRTEEADDSTVAKAILGPGDDVSFTWKPRSRQTDLEETVFFADVASVVGFRAGVIAAHHQVRLRIAQGEMKSVRIKIPDNMTVTAVEGEELGAWRYDPVQHEAEAKLMRPVSGEYELRVLTQIAMNGLPADLSIQRLSVQEAERQHWIMGLVSSPEVYLTITEHPQAMNVDDFSRQAAALLKSAPGLEEHEVRYAYRFLLADEAVKLEVHEVRPEIQVEERAGFTIADDRLVYNGELSVRIAKAGMFSVGLAIPDGYDIDALEAGEISHWDEEETDGRRVVEVHLKKKLLGAVAMKLTLSQAIAELPDEIQAPRVEVLGALKHTGVVLISSARSVRLSVSHRDGVGELNPLELGMKTPGVLAFKLLKPDWALSLRTEVIEPRVTVEFLHVATVNDGLVEHTHYLRYRLHNAGVKELEVALPKDALGVVLTGPEIAKKRETEPGSRRWRIELAEKWFSRPYPLTIRYETQFGRAEGEVAVLPVTPVGTDLQRGHVVVLATDKMELVPAAVSASLQPAEVRRIPRTFGAGDLSHAAFCYRASSSDTELKFRATRHEKVPLLEAEVLDAGLMTVINERGESMNHLTMKLRVGTKQHLAARLPKAASVWSLLVNGRSTVPSKRTSPKGEEEVLIPLTHVAQSRRPVAIELIYVSSLAAGELGGETAFTGPRFDLPLRNIQWQFYLPEGYEYDYLDSTLNVDKKLLRREVLQHYDLSVYESEVVRANLEDQRKAIELQQHGQLMARQGLQSEAKQALESAYDYSFSDPALNEDARVQLHRLMRQQAVVGLVGRRDRLRPENAGPSAMGGDAGPDDRGDRFSLEEAERLQNSLSKTDSENLELITSRMIEAQEAASGTTIQLRFSMPIHGRLLNFHRDLQVEPDAEMAVRLQAKRTKDTEIGRSASWAGGLFMLLWLAWGTIAGHSKETGESAQ